MNKIHLKRSLGVRHTLCGIAPDKDRFTNGAILAGFYQSFYQEQRETRRISTKDPRLGWGATLIHKKQPP